jgi:SAM-dependent methyltransferase
MDTAVYEAEATGRRRTAQRHYDIVSRHTPSGSLLDVGCASGLFLDLAARRGWQVTGVEPNAALSRKAEALLGPPGKVFGVSLQEAPLTPASFDAITLWDVLEHVTDPAGFLRRCRDLLKPGGYLFANVPNVDSLMARLFGRRWPLWLPEHLNYFNRRSLEECSRRAGLASVRFGRRPTAFSIGYIAYRLSQHHVPGAAFLHRVFSETSFARLTLPIYMGELLVVWRRDR